MAAGPDWRDPSSGASPSSSLRFSLIERWQRLQRESMDERFEKMRAQAQRAREEELSRLDRRYEMRMRDVRDGGAAVIARHRVTAQEVIAKAATQQNLARGGAPLPTDTALALSQEGDASVAQALGEYVIRILSSEWLLSQPNGFVLRRQSFLPTEAFLPPRAMHALPRTRRQSPPTVPLLHTRILSLYSSALHFSHRKPSTLPHCLTASQETVHSEILLSILLAQTGSNGLQ